jgi:3-methyladenine DNA glycosylase AlkC
MTTTQQTPEARKAFKDYFDAEAAKSLAVQLKRAYRRFDADAFVERATDQLEPLAFAARVTRFAEALRAGLPDAIPRALSILADSLPPLLPDCEAVTDGWLQWPLGQFIADYGLDYPDQSFAAMLELTQRFSSEFAVRPFVEHRPEETFARLLALTDHPSPHVRRWCSEGVRPRLPWGKKLRALVADPSPIWPIVEALRDDPELYVRRSVANTLNDIAKDHPDAVVERCLAWMRPGRGRKSAPEGRSWIVKHALRTLIKDGHPGALEVVGFGPPQALSATLSVTPAEVAIGGEVELNAALHSEAKGPQQLVIDYVVHFVRKGDKTSGKVFKWTTTELAAGAKRKLSKRHKLKRTTIRALYPGTHQVELQVNGARIASASFELRAE